jgi:hypothetical protein
MVMTSIIAKLGCLATAAPIFPPRGGEMRFENGPSGVGKVHAA